MAKISDTTLYQWKDGEVVTATEYKKERDILRVGVNDNDQKHFEHISKEVDPTSDDSTRDKHVSNLDLKNFKDQLTNHDLRIDNRYTIPEVDTKVDELKNDIKINSDNLATHNHDGRYMTKTELSPYLQGGDTQVRIEVFTIVTSDNGDGTFTYENIEGEQILGSLGNQGEQIFELQLGQYRLNSNFIKAFINDTLYRSVASGGLKEIDATHIALSSPEATGTEITFEYYQRVGVTGEHNVIYGDQTPPPTDGQTIWLKVIG